MTRMAMLLSCLVLLAAGCASSGNPDEPRPLKSIEYSYGVDSTGVFRRIYISDDGHIRVVDKGVTNTGNISDVQRNELSAMFVGWDKLEDNYPGIPDAPVWTITYEGKTVRAGQGAKDIPEKFARIQNRIEYLSRIIPPRTW